MKKLISMMALMLCLTVPATLTSCDDDDVQTVLNIVDQLFLQSGDELSGTQWMASDQTSAIAFGNSSDGLYFDGTDENGLPFTYTIGSDGSTLTFTFTNTQTVVTYTITEYTEGQTMTLCNNSTGVTTAYSIFVETEQS